MPQSRRAFLQASVGALAVTGTARPASNVLRQPYLQRLLKDRVSILWTNAQPVAASVEVIASDGTTKSFPAVSTAYQPATTQLPAAFYQYQADVTGLEAGVAYQYRVISDGVALPGDLAQSTFRTPSTGDFSFLVFGDSGEDSPAQRTLIRLMSAEPDIAKVIHVGDLAYDSGRFDQLDHNYFGLNAPMMRGLSFFTTPGNHEYYTDYAAPYLAGHRAPESNVPAQDEGRYYSYDWGDAHFTSIDSNLLTDEHAAPRMLAWLKSDLDATRKYWKVVFLHHPPYPTGNHADDPISALVRKNVNPIVERYGVQLVLAGHEHGYERSLPLINGGLGNSSQATTTYVISGGGGAPLHNVGALPECARSMPVFNYLRVDVTGTSLTYTATGLDGGVIDRLTLTPPPVLATGGIVSSGDYSGSMAPGSLVTIFGENLALRPAVPTEFPLPTQLGGISVTANGVPVPLLYASPTQINLQMPFEVSGEVTINVTTQNGSTSSNVTVLPLAPSILAVYCGVGPNSSRNPGIAGGAVTVYLTGLGAPVGHIANGQPATIPTPVSVPVQVRLGKSILQPLYAGLAPGYAGLDQVNFLIPATLPPGSYPLVISAAGIDSLPATLTVAPPLEPRPTSIPRPAPTPGVPLFRQLSPVSPSAQAVAP